MLPRGTFTSVVAVGAWLASPLYHAGANEYRMGYNEDGHAAALATSAAHAPPRCNVTGLWCWLPAPDWKPLAFVEDAAGRFVFQRSQAGQPGAPWTTAEGRLFTNGSLEIDYGCGSGPPCQVAGSIDAACGSMTVANGVYSRSCPPPPPPEPPQPPLPLPRSFAGDVAWLGAAAVYVLGSSQQQQQGGTATIFTPNMQPGGYGGEFARDYTYGLIHTPWWRPAPGARRSGGGGGGGAWNLTLDGFISASELLLRASAPDGLVADAVTAAGAGLFNNCSEQYCAFPPGSPLPRPGCCTHGNCSVGSMDNAPFAVFNVVFLSTVAAAQRGAVRVVSRTIPPRWRSIRFRLAHHTYAHGGASYVW